MLTCGRDMIAVDIESSFSGQKHMESSVVHVVFTSPHRRHVKKLKSERADWILHQVGPIIKVQCN